MPDDISKDAEEFLDGYGDGIFDILETEPKKDSKIYKLKHYNEYKFILIGLFFASIVHIYSYINYGWKPLIRTPLFIKKEPVIFVSWVGAVALIVYGSHRRYRRRIESEDRSPEYIAIHSGWHAYKELQRGNLQNALNFWENGGYYMNKNTYNGPDELRQLYNEYDSVENKVEYLKENLPDIMEEISGSEIKSIVLPYDYFQEKHHGLITEINKTYNTGAYRACSVLIRNLGEKLIENVLREELDADTEDKSLHDMIQQMNGNIGQFEQYSQHIEFEKEKFKRSLSNLRTVGNSGAHEATPLANNEEDIENILASSLFALYILSELEMRACGEGSHTVNGHMPEYDPSSQVDMSTL